MRNLEGKVAVVTGAAHGIGRETALALAQKGCRLAICDVNEAALEGVRHELEAGGTTVTAHQVDRSRACAMNWRRAGQRSRRIRSTSPTGRR
ncbi:MAG: SDR family NAD(P)-dependent oxidoreductase [Deltaproteobacteria bacterium]|nr:SDR family NAD(P)-dependent oxidoreductase [Deltaproteobacteria bacterium]